MSRSSPALVTLIADTREQEPYSFDSRLVLVERRALPAGDYSVGGLEGVIHQRARFRRELLKLAGYRAACVVVEAGLLEVLQGRYRGGAHPNAVLGSALAITLDYRIPVFFCSSRQAACQFVQAYLLGAHARWSA